MKRCKIIGLMFLVQILLVLNVNAQEKKQNINKLSEGFYNISFDFQLRPNNLVYTGKDGILIVDTGHEDKANDLMETIKSISKNNISYVINSHLNHDHIGGNKICGEYAEMINYKNMSELLNRKVI
ncbi:MBL fold metallo-hydrolase, partial [Bacteroidota bacterium]